MPLSGRKSTPEGQARLRPHVETLRALTERQRQAEADGMKAAADWWRLRWQLCDRRISAIIASGEATDEDFYALV